MTPALALRFALREMRGGVRGFRVFLACLALGVAAVAAVGSVKTAIEAGLSDQGRAILGGDAELRLTYRRADAAELARVASVAESVSEIVDFRSMAVAESRISGEVERGLTQVKGVDAAYPLYGEVALAPPREAVPVRTMIQPLAGAPSTRSVPVMRSRSPSSKVSTT